MDVYSTSFTYPCPRNLSSSSPTHDGSSDGPHLDAPDAKAIENVNQLAMMAQTLHGVHISFNQASHPGCWNWYISGAYQQVMTARGMILKEGPIQNRAAIKVARSEILDSPQSRPQLKAEVRVRLDEVATQTLAHIAVVNSQQSLSNRTPPDGISSNSGWSGLETERVCELVVTGSGDSVDLAKVRLLVMLDELNGLHAECCEIDYKLHSIIAGRQRSVLQTIQEETATNIYLPSPLQGLLGPGTSAPGGSVRNNSIWITGEFFGVQRARDMLYNVSIGKSKAMQSRDTAILPRKLDWMVTDRSEDLKTIMSDNATFIQFPPLGSSTSLISVFGDSRVNILRTIRTIMQLACQFYVSSFWLLPMQFNALLPPPTLNATQMASVIRGISLQTGAEIVFKTMCFEMHGLEHQVRQAVQLVLDLEVVKSFHHEIRFQIELANEHRDFISGKKNGKINKIMQTTNLPAEISFHVPETYHKRIIGVGGRSIQRIMKKYGVYVKFSNAEEFASLGGYNDNEDNNAINLDNLKQSVMELVNPKPVAIPRRYHRTLLGEKSIFIHDIEAKTNSHVRFPDKASASDVVTIFGPESQVQIAAAMLLDHVPFEADMSIPPNPEVPHLCASPEFLNLVERIKRDLQVSVAANIRQATGIVDVPDYSFKFRCQRSNSDFLVTAREMLEQFLINHSVQVFPSPTVHTHKRGDSFAEAFPHFDSKVLSAASRIRNHESADLGRPSEISGRSLRMASSSPDVKALFNNPAYIQQLEEQDPQVSFSADSDYWPLPPIGTMPTVAAEREDSLKRGSDSLLEAKLKEQFLNKPRSMGNRAQSLDLTFSLSKIAEAARGGLPNPDSPTNSTYELDGESPCRVYHPTTSTKKAVIGPPGSRASINSVNMPIQEGLGDENVEEVARVISNLGL
ncbi:cytoplasmic protein [Flagelloscypha sp. PMI_526]|nr:cytoplasmic protein [Flagelloscypha sp. PMI_526]